LILIVKADERRRAVLHNLAELFGSEALHPLDYCEKNWNEEIYCDGGPVSVCTTGAMIYAASALRRPFDRCVLLESDDSISMQDIAFLNRVMKS
jgi:monoamine oxidase